MEMVFGHARLEVEVVAGQADADHDGAHPFEGYWFVVTEHDADGNPTGLGARFAVQPTVAEVLVASLREHLESMGREVTDDALRELMAKEGDGTVQKVTAIGNRAQRRHGQFGGAGKRDA